MVAGKSDTAQRSTATLVFCDIDNTLIRGAVVFLFAIEAWRQGFLGFRDIAPAIAEQRRFVRRGEIEHRMPQIKERALSLVKGHSEERFLKVAEHTWQKRVRPRLFEEVVSMLRGHQERGHEVHLVSASPRPLVQVIADGLGLDGALGTELMVSDGRFQGELDGPMLRGVHKAAAVIDVAERRKLDLSKCFALSDSIADQPMLEAVGNPTAINPDSALHRLAVERQWPIVWPKGTTRYRRLRR
jgi:HAD superfamily hydrolase (TIGR01490 family)